MPEHPLLSAFYDDGSYRDVPIGGSPQDFLLVASLLQRLGWQLSIAGEPIQQVDESHVFAAPEGHTCCVAATRAGCTIHLWSWNDARSADRLDEVDFDPREVHAGNIHDVEEALSAMAHALNRTLHLVPENRREPLLATFRPTGQTTVHERACAAADPRPQRRGGA